RVLFRSYGDPLEQAYPLSTWVGAAGAVLVVAAVLGYLYRRNRRLRPALHPVAVAAAALGLVVAALSLSGALDAALARQWQGFGVRAIALPVLLVVSLVLQHARILG